MEASSHKTILIFLALCIMTVLFSPFALALDPCFVANPNMTTQELNKINNDIRGGGLQAGLHGCWM